MNKNKKTLFLSCLIILLLVLSSCTSNKENNQDEQVENKTEVVSVQTQGVVLGDIEVLREFSSKFQPVKTHAVIPKMPGKLNKLHVKVGQEVKKGDVLLELDTSEVELQVKQAQIAYDIAKLNVQSANEKRDGLNADKKRLDQAVEDIKNAESQIDDGILKLDGGMADLDKLLEAGQIDKKTYEVKKGAINNQKEELQDKRRELYNQRSEVEQGRKAIDSGIQSIPSKELLDLQLEQAKIGLDMANNTKQNLKITSPIDGVIATVSAEEGDMIAQAMPPITIIDIDTLYFNINVPDSDINKLRVDQEVKVHVDALNKDMDGIVESISPAIDMKTQAFLVTIKVNNDEKNIRAGMFGKANIILDRKEQVITIPKNAVIMQGGKNYVFIVDNDTAYRREIGTGLDDGENVEVLSGISQGDNVVVKGQDYLKDGVKVNIVRGEQ